MSFGDDSQLMSQNSNNDDQSSNPNIPESLAWLLLFKISETLSYIHRKQIAHLDLRPANIFISDPSYNDDDVSDQNITNSFLTEKITNGEFVLKLGDLGHASRLDETSFVEEGEGRYVAKELINSTEKVDYAKADMFSMGATVYEICLGYQLSSSAYEWHVLRDGNFDKKFINSYSNELCNCIITLMHPSPASRPSSMELFEKLKQRYDNELDVLRNEIEYLRNENEKLKKQI